MPTRTVRRSSSPSDVTLDSPRVRFNWGFHDATADEIAGRPVRDMSGHFCRSYAAGYLAGRSTMARLITEAVTAGVSAERPQSSEPAWLEHVASAATR